MNKEIKEIIHDSNEAANKTAAILLKLGHTNASSAEKEGTSVFISRFRFSISRHSMGCLTQTTLKRYIAELAAPPKQPPT